MRALRGHLRPIDLLVQLVLLIHQQKTLCRRIWMSSLLTGVGVHPRPSYPDGYWWVIIISCLYGTAAARSGTKLTYKVYSTPRVSQ